LAWYDPSWLYRQRITINHTRVAEDLTDFPVLITDAIAHASLFTHARSDGAEIVVTGGDETTRLKRELVTYDTVAGELELYVRIPSLSSVADTEVYIYYGNAGAAEENDADTWNADYGVVYHLKEDPAGTAPQAKDSTVNAVHGTYDIAGATVEANTLWGGSCILFDNGPRLVVADNPAIENADRITIEAWVNTLSWPTRAVVCRKEAATSSTTSAGASPGTSSGLTAGCSTTSRARSGTAAGAISSAPMTRTPARTTSASI
jgi:biopolymer transport protein ExbB